MKNQTAVLKAPAEKVLRPKGKRHPDWSELSVYLWILPSLVLIVGIVIIPVFEMFRTSLSQVSQSGIVHGFNQFKNYLSLFKDTTFVMVLMNTLIWTAVVVGVSTILSIGVALLLNQKFHGRTVLRAIIIIPWATSLIITASVWKWIFDYNYGALNMILTNLHIIRQNIFWLATPSTAFPILLWAGIFDTIPFTTFVLLAGLQSIPLTLYESASIDGAGFWRKFTRITLPMLSQALSVSIVLNIIYVFNSFPIIWTITRGDPLNETDTIVTYLYKQAFIANHIGPAAAISVIGFIILMAFSALYLSMSMRSEKYEKS